MENLDVQGLWDKGMAMAMEYAPKVLLAILVLLIGLWIIKAVKKLVVRTTEKSKMEPALQGFIVSLVSWILKILLFIAVADMFGVETTSFVAIIGAAGLAIGLALQGTLANFAGGVLVMIFKPYKMGDLVESQGVLGVVKEIQIFNSILLTPENKTAIMPNGAIMNNHILNYTKEGKIRVDLNIGVAYDADLKLAKKTMMDVLVADNRVLKDPEPTVAVSELGDNAVNFVVRPWCHPDDYWGVYFDTLEHCKNALDNAGVGIPFPQLDVHMITQ